jgi:hypothetical protein
MIPVSARPQTYALDRAATGIGQRVQCWTKLNNNAIALITQKLRSDYNNNYSDGSFGQSPKQDIRHVQKPHATSSLQH